MPLNFLDELTPRPQPNVEEILQTEDSSFLETISKPFTTLLDILDTPGSVVRGLLAGEGERAVSGIFDPSQRVSGKELIGQEDNDSILAELGGIAASIVTDPLLFTGSLVGASKTGKALLEASDTLKRINVIEKAAATGDKAALIVNSALGEAESIAYNVLAKAGLKEATDETIKAMGLKGLSFSLPFSQAEYVPKSFNKALASLLDSAAESRVGQFFEPTVSGAKSALKFLFNTKAETVEAQTIKELKEANRQLAGHQLGKKQVELEKLIDKVGATDAKNIIREGETIGYDREGNYLPEQMKAKVKEYEATRIANLTNTIDKLKLKFADNIPEGVDPAVHAKKLEDQIKLQTGKAQKDIQKFSDKVQALLERNVKNEGLIATESGTYPAEFLQLLKKEGLTPPQLLIDEQRKFIPVTQTSEFSQHYVPRVQSEYGRSFIAQNKKAKRDFERAIGSKMTGVIDEGFTKRRHFREKNLEELNDYFKKKYGAKEDVFSMDPSIVFTQRKLKSESAISKANSINTAIAVAAEPIEKKLKDGYVHVSDLLAMGDDTERLTGIRNPVSGEIVEWGIGASAKKIKESLRSIGMNLQMPKQFVDDIMKKETYVNHPKIEKFFQEIVDPLNGLYRKLLTAVPAHLSTNGFGNLWSNWIAGVKGEDWFDAGKILTNYYKKYSPDNRLTPLFQKFTGELTKEQEKLLEKAVAFGGVNKNVINEYAQLAGDARHSLVRLENELAPSAIIRAGERIPYANIPFEYTTDLNRFQEEVAKLAHFIRRTKEGGDPLSAGLSVKKYLFDYSDLTDVEKQLGRRAVLFYTFMRKNIPLALTETFMNKRAYLAAQSINRSQEDYLPEFVQNQGMVPIGGDKYFNARMPFFEANSFAGEGRNQIRDKVIGILSPIISVPFGSKDRLVENLPISRQAKLVQRFFEEDVGPSNVAQLAGLSIYDIDKDKAKLSKAKEILKRKLSRQSDTVKYEDYFVPRDKIKNPDTERYMQELRQLRK